MPKKLLSFECVDGTIVNLLPIVISHFYSSDSKRYYICLDDVEFQVSQIIYEQVMEDYIKYYDDVLD